MSHYRNENNLEVDAIVELFTGQMYDFPAKYKKILSHTFYPHGYKNWKNFFYKETDTMCFFIGIRKDFKDPRLEITIDPIPCCADLKSNDYEPPSGGYDVTAFYKRLMPDLLKPESSSEFAMKRFNATDDKAACGSLHTVCNDMDDLILPYIHKFTDLDYCYNELLILSKISGCEDIEQSLRDYIL